MRQEEYMQYFNNPVALGFWTAGWMFATTMFRYLDISAFQEMAAAFAVLFGIGFIVSVIKHNVDQYDRIEHEREMQKQSRY